MNALFLIFIFAFDYYNCADCEQRTKVFNQRGNDNINYYYFDIRTYLNTNESIKYDTYRRRLDSSDITCAGAHCVNNKWTEGPNGYHVQHIIPSANNIPELAGCCFSNPKKDHCDNTNNFIMAYSTWNMQLSNGYLGEKALIYGPAIIKNAYDTVYTSCKGVAPTYYPDELCLDNDDNSDKFDLLSLLYIFIFVICFIAFALGFMIVLSIVKCKNIYDNKYLANNLTNNLTNNLNNEVIDIIDESD